MDHLFLRQRLEMKIIKQAKVYSCSLIALIVFKNTVSNSKSSNGYTESINFLLNSTLSKIKFSDSKSKLPSSSL